MLGRGGLGGRSNWDWAPISTPGGNALLGIVSAKTVLDGYGLNIFGGSGRNGARGRRESDNQNGFVGGMVRINIHSSSIALYCSSMVAVGGRGGDGPAGKNGGRGGHAEINIKPKTGA